jgi:hypothetical protein
MVRSVKLQGKSILILVLLHRYHCFVVGGAVAFVGGIEKVAALGSFGGYGLFALLGLLL